LVPLESDEKRKEMEEKKARETRRKREREEGIRKEWRELAFSLSILPFKICDGTAAQGLTTPAPHKRGCREIPMLGRQELVS